MPSQWLEVFFRETKKRVFFSRRILIKGIMKSYDDFLSVHVRGPQVLFIEEPTMSRIAFAVAIVSMSAWSTVSFARHRPSPCACQGVVVTQTGPVAESNPPGAPQQGQTVMNRSVEPSTSTVTSQPRMGNTYFNSPGSSSSSSSRMRRYEIRHQHIRSHFYSMDH
jgi:hypothetical protein